MTAGNASGVNDGAACVLITNREFANTHGLKPLARVIGIASAGLNPNIWV